jgi:hypothetical protein
MTACPDCSSQHLVLGETTTTTPAFRPKGLRFFCIMRKDPTPKQGNRFVACLDCGLVWSGIDQNELSSLLTEKGTKKTKKQYRLTNN